MSVLGDRVWVARNAPYGAIINYYLVEPGGAGERVQLEIRDASGRVVRMLDGPNHAGLNRVVWNLAETSTCGPAEDATERRGRRGGRGSGGTWLRAIPGEYTVRLRAFGETVEQPIDVRLDPRVDASAEDLDAWYRAARTIERTECTIDQASARVRGLDRQLSELEASVDDAGVRDAAAAVRSELRPIFLGFVGDVRDPGHVNLSSRINWLTIQVGNYTGRPTPAQSEWIATYASQTEDYVRRLGTLGSGSLARLNTTLRSAGLPEVGTSPSRRTIRPGTALRR